VEQIVKEIEAIRVRKGETVFLRPSRDMTLEEVQHLGRRFEAANLDCKVVVLTTELKVEAIAE
jgi:L-asparaginase/Glu-tRNA(Gln) amidotransferase subunit D